MFSGWILRKTQGVSQIQDKSSLPSWDHGESIFFLTRCGSVEKPHCQPSEPAPSPRGPRRQHAVTAESRPRTSWVFLGGLLCLSKGTFLMCHMQTVTGSTWVNVKINETKQMKCLKQCLGHAKVLAAIIIIITIVIIFTRQWGELAWQ